MNTHYDIVIIGAGIQGVACAKEACEQGFSVCILEQFPNVGLATSSKSSKLIHGGLRYLESGQFKLVHECLHERRYLLEHYPNLVKLTPFYIPIYRHTQRRPYLVRLGLMLYSLLSQKGFKTIPKSHWGELDGLDTTDLQTVFQYYDAQTDDQKLTQTVMQQAIQQGATLITEAQFSDADYANQACRIRYQQHNQTHTVHSRYLINASGPWVNQVLQHILPAHAAIPIELVLGSHIVLPRPTRQGVYYLEVRQDKRAVFVMPWGNDTLVGTTEVPFHQSPTQVSAPSQDINYLLNVYNDYFKTTLTPHDVKYAFAGLRVLAQGDDTPFARPRETIIQHDSIRAPHLFSLYGGKLTAHHATARQLIQLLQQQENLNGTARTASRK